MPSKEESREKLQQKKNVIENVNRIFQLIAEWVTKKILIEVINNATSEGILNWIFER